MKEWQVEGTFGNDPLAGRWSLLNDPDYGVEWPVELETAVQVWDALRILGFDGGHFRLVNIKTGEAILCAILQNG